MDVGVVGKRQTDLLQVVLTGISPCRFAGRLDCRQQQRDERANNGNDHK